MQVLRCDVMTMDEQTNVGASEASADRPFYPPRLWKKLRNVRCPKCNGYVIVRKSEIHMFKCRSCGNEFD